MATASKKIRILLSAAILFQVVGVITIPNTSSYTGQKLAKLYLPLFNGLGLGGLWAFFAPEPFSPPMFLDYTLEMRDAIPISGRFPNVNEKFFSRSSENRRTSIARFMMSDDKYVEYMFLNYLCHQTPGMISAKVWAVRGLQPDYNMVREQGKKMSETIEYKSQFMGDYACKQKN